MTATTLEAGTPVRLTGRLDSNLSRWLWLVKMLLAVPYYIVLAFLWIAFLVVTVVAGCHVLVTGRFSSSASGSPRTVRRADGADRRQSCGRRCSGVSPGRRDPHACAGCAPHGPAAGHRAQPRGRRDPRFGHHAATD